MITTESTHAATITAIQLLQICHCHVAYDTLHDIDRHHGIIIKTAAKESIRVMIEYRCTSSCLSSVIGCCRRASAWSRTSRASAPSTASFEIRTSQPANPTRLELTRYGSTRVHPSTYIDSSIDRSNRRIFVLECALKTTRYCPFIPVHLSSILLDASCPSLPDSILGCSSPSLLG